MVYWLELRLTHFEFQFEVDTMRGRDLRQFTVAVPTCKWLYEPSELRSVDLFAGVSIDDVSVYMQTLFPTWQCAGKLRRCIYFVHRLAQQQSEGQGHGRCCGGPPLGGQLRGRSEQKGAGSFGNSCCELRRGARQGSACLRDRCGGGWRFRQHFVAAFDVLDQERQAEPFEIEADSFTFQLLGGAWQMKRTGRSFYGHRCEIRKETTARAFAEQFWDATIGEL